MSEFGADIWMVCCWCAIAKMITHNVNVLSQWLEPIDKPCVGHFWRTSGGQAFNTSNGPHWCGTILAQLINKHTLIMTARVAHSVHQNISCAFAIPPMNSWQHSTGSIKQSSILWIHSINTFSSWPHTASYH